MTYQQALDYANAQAKIGVHVIISIAVFGTTDDEHIYSVRCVF